MVSVKEAQQLADIDKLEKYARSPMLTTLLVLAHKGQSVRSNSKLAKAIAHTKGVIFDAKKYYENQIPAWIQKYMEAHQYLIKPDAAALLVEYLGNDLGHIANELDKLMLNLPIKTTVTHQHVTDNIGVNKEYNVFELQDALANKQTLKVFKMVGYFTANPKAGPLVLVIGSLYRFFSKLYIYHHVYRQPESTVLKAMGINSAWAFFPVFIKTGKFEARRSVRTLSNAMDVGNPSNFERIDDFYGSTWNLVEHVKSYSVSDEQTLLAIHEFLTKYDYLLDPHGAVGYSAIFKRKL